ncbi:SMP-30/gluconolactonase/LRE family protein [Rapidithrix thailandica]|uniref:SMP-30/gluconolactonase/LRE family protein n=1 Tax=Rapidithrix thailandica TaxID=413964 RepID=A0AAW9SDT7_9BACT
MSKKRILTGSITAVLLVVIANLMIKGYSINPQAWTPPVKPELKGPLAENELLDHTQRIDLDGWWGPEDIETDSLGNLYCGVHIGKTDFSDGRVLKIDPSGKVSTYCNTGSWVAGMEFDQGGNLIACDQKRGLISIDPKGQITVLADHDEKGKPLLLPNDVDIAPDGMIYFSNTSSNYSFSLPNIRKIIFEMRPDGGLYRYNPTTRKVTTLIDSTFFGNGVAVSEDNDFVLMADLLKYRITRYWLKGPKKGQAELFLDNLPGFPNGITRDIDGSFWIGFSTQRIDQLDQLQPNIFLKRLVYALPLWLQPQQEAYGLIMHVNRSGEVLKTYHDPKGKTVPEASSIEAHQGYLYIGGDQTGHIGKYKLEQ